MLAKISAQIKQELLARYQRWIRRRIPPSRTITLDMRRIFIFPSKAGLWFAVMLAVMLLAAINYQNNMAFALVFFLSSFFIVAILHTFANLSGLTITALRAGPAFMGDSVEFQIQVSRDGDRDYFDIEFSWPDSESELVTLTESGDQLVKLHLHANKRGIFKPERLYIDTHYPVGLLRAWTWIALDIEALVYPKPIAGELSAAQVSESTTGEVVEIVGSDDFYQFKEYQVGDSLKHVSWKSYAKEQGMQTKQFAAYSEKRVWLDWDSCSGDIEIRLQTLCYWALKYEKSNNDYGLRLPGIEIAPAQGEQQLESILSALARYNSGVESL